MAHRQTRVLSLALSLFLFIAAVAVRAFFPHLKPAGIDSGGLADIGEKIFTVLVTVGVVSFLRWFIIAVHFTFLHRYTPAPVIKTIVSLFMYFGAAVFLLHTVFRLNPLPIVTTSAVLTGVIALALQDTLKNFFTGLWINTERIVAKGDWIKVGDKEGRVTEVTWRTTRITTRKNQYIYIPNRILVDGVLENYTYPTPLQMIEIDVGAGYDHQPSRIVNILLEVAADTRSVSHEPGPEVLVENFGDFSVTYRLRVWINDYAIVPEVTSEIKRKVSYSFMRHNIEFPYPVRTVHHKPAEKTTPTGDFILNTLKRIDFLELLKEDEFKKVVESAKLEAFGEGETIVKQGDKGDTCYFIQSGSAEVLLRGEGGKEEFIAVLNGGDFFGEMSLFAGEPRNATVVAKEDAICIVIGSRVFREMFGGNHDIAERLSRLLAKRSAELEDVKSRIKSRMEAEKYIQKNLFIKIKDFFMTDGQA